VPPAGSQQGRHRRPPPEGHERGRGASERCLVENLTVRNFDRIAPNAENGNEGWWYEAHGWHGNYLTVYDAGLLGGCSSL